MSESKSLEQLTTWLMNGHGFQAEVTFRGVSGKKPHEYEAFGRIGEPGGAGNTPGMAVSDGVTECKIILPQVNRIWPAWFAESPRSVSRRTHDVAHVEKSETQTTLNAYARNAGTKPEDGGTGIFARTADSPSAIEKTHAHLDQNPGVNAAPCRNRYVPCVVRRDRDGVSIAADPVTRRHAQARLLPHGIGAVPCR